jgi:hypothetical protein
MTSLSYFIKGVYNYNRLLLAVGYCSPKGFERLLPVDMTHQNPTPKLFEVEQE